MRICICVFSILATIYCWTIDNIQYNNIYIKYQKPTNLHVLGVVLGNTTTVHGYRSRFLEIRS